MTTVMAVETWDGQPPQRWQLGQATDEEFCPWPPWIDLETLELAESKQTVRHTGHIPSQGQMGQIGETSEQFPALQHADVLCSSTAASVN